MAFRSAREIINLFRQLILFKNGIQKVQTANAFINTTKGTRNLRLARKYRRPEEKEVKSYDGLGPHQKVESATQSLAARGFAREKKSYKPLPDVSDQIQAFCKSICPEQTKSSCLEISLSDSLLKYKLLTECIRRFNHDIPNPVLCKLKTVGDVVSFYNTPVDGVLPYDSLVQQNEKFPNLHVISEYLDFNPDTDTFFSGQTAFPGRDRIIHAKAGEKLEKIVEWPQV